ncbi:TetR/AcrR family transcriptional regulator [Clostridium niameyense]|uniref:TetR/AcrR family transcriptional regulator n=1 Tax=Clostridium niameyense TaxID=1622073 RepID=UPI00067EDB77|nr:TetR/AcrR family transcriptional regulator [Clostridium niameyense]
MPKIIKNIEEKISNAAMELFGEYGYESIDMRHIAQKTGVAVGTLYNYYTNKSELFLEVFRLNWNETLFKLKEEGKINKESREKLKAYVKILYESLENRKGISEAIFKISCNKQKNNVEKHIIYFTEEIVLNIRDLFQRELSESNFIKEYDVVTRLIEILLSTMSVLIENHEDEKEVNIQFLYTIVSSFL